jgi:endoglucanase
MKLIRVFVWVLIVCLTGCQARGSESFIHADGRKLMLEGKPFLIKGINFSNYYGFDMSDFDLLSSAHHSEIDFLHVKEMGFNAIRFAFNGNWYADSPDIFWAWLDRNVQLSRKYELYLILDLHVPIGGFWLDPRSEKVSFEIWTNRTLREQNLALWRAIAARYKDETYIAAYDILNEPVTSDQTGEQWRQLAQEIVNTIRTVDRNHLLIVGHLYGVDKDYGVEDVETQFLVSDDNVLYDFHFYEPIDYTHQHASWLARPLSDDAKYPDAEAVIPTRKAVLIPSSRIKSKPIVAGTSDWVEYKSQAIQIVGDSDMAAVPMAVMRGKIQGTVYFDDLKVLEYDSHGKFLREVMREPLSKASIQRWWSWEKSEDQATSASFNRLDTIGYNDTYSLEITKRTDDDAMVGWTSDNHWFKLVKGNYYQISGYMRGNKVEFVDGSNPGVANFELDVYGDTQESGEKAFLVRNKTYLEHELMKLMRFGIDNNVPMSVMEFGVIRYCFELGKGGEQWVADMIDLLRQHRLSFAYWVYRDENMGIYLSEDNHPPTQANVRLINVLKRKLDGSTKEESARSVSGTIGGDSYPFSARLLTRSLRCWDPEVRRCS